MERGNRERPVVAAADSAISTRKLAARLAAAEGSRPAQSYGARTMKTLLTLAAAVTMASAQSNLRVPLLPEPDRKPAADFPANLFPWRRKDSA